MIRSASPAERPPFAVAVGCPPRTRRYRRFAGGPVPVAERGGRPPSNFSWLDPVLSYMTRVWRAAERSRAANLSGRRQASPPAGLRKPAYGQSFRIHSAGARGRRESRLADPARDADHHGIGPVDGVAGELVLSCGRRSPAFCGRLRARHRTAWLTLQGLSRGGEGF